MISVSKLWGNNKFNKLTNNAKLLYLFLATTPNINYVGVVSLSTETIINTLSISLDELREITKELKDKQYIYVVSDVDDLYWIVPAHFSTVGNSDSTIEKIKSDMKSLPNKVVDFLESIGISANKKKKTFNKPTLEEIETYSLSSGFMVDAETFYNFYENNPKSNELFWYDGRGKLVIDWKAKLRKVWFREDNKIKLAKNAPKGFEHFYVKDSSGIIFPEDWKDGKPWHKDFLLTKKLQREFLKIKL